MKNYLVFRKLAIFELKMTIFRKVTEVLCIENCPIPFSSQKWSFFDVTSSRPVRNNEWTWFILGLGQSFVYDHVISNQIKIRVREK